MHMAWVTISLCMQTIPVANTLHNSGTSLFRTPWDRFIKCPD